MNYKERFKIIKKHIEKTFPDLEVRYSFNKVSDNYKLFFYQQIFHLNH